MATIEDLNISISLMSHDELLARMLQLRKSRRITKTSIKKKKSASKAKPKINLHTMAEGMSKDEKAELLAMLEGL